MKYPFRKLAVLLVAVALLMAVLIPAAMADGDGGTAQPTEEASPTPGEPTPAPGETKPPLNEFERKLDSQLLQLINPEYAPKGPASSESEQPKSLSVYIKLAPGSDIDTLTQVVDEVKHVDEHRGVAVARVNTDKLVDLVSLNAVAGVRNVLPPVIWEGAAASEGDGMLGADDFRTATGKDGTGVKVGIISDGANSYESSITTHDLPGEGDPGSVTILPDAIGNGDEGTAMMEIVHDLAPGAQLYFHDCGETVYDFIDAIDALAAAGCTIICDDVCWPDEPFYEDGVVASHVRELAAAGDILFVSAAGNAAAAHYQGDYAKTGIEYGHNSKSIYVNLDPGDSILVVLQWNDPFGNSSNDYDLLLSELGDFTFLGTQHKSYRDQFGAGDDPFEYIQYTNESPDTQQKQIWVKGWPGAATRNLEIYIYSDGAEIEPENIVASDSIFGHPAVPQVVACGAIDVSDPDWDMIESFSSQGPVTILGEAAKRQKPEVIGADGVNITGVGGFGSYNEVDDKYRFFGTSASAPHVAAMAALLWTEFPEFDALQIRSLITGGAHDLGAAGYDGVYGFGRADAQGAYDFGFATVTFNPQGGSEVPSQTMHKYSTAAVPEPPTRDTYTFAGWYKESTCKTAWNFDTGIVTGNMTLYAKWVVHKVSFNPQGGSSVASANVTANTQVPRPADPKRTGYTFAGWFKESSCLNEWVFDTELMPAKSITLYAKWNINYYNVVFDSKGGSDVETKEHIAYNTTFPAPLIPSREHYTFKGWYKDSACKYAWSFSKYKMPAADATGALTLYAKWSAHTFTVSFNSQGGSRVSSKKAAYNSRISAPRSPKRTGYTFAGWHKEPECLNPWVFGTDTIAGKTTLYARWNINHYTVKYDARGGTLSGPASDIVEYKSLLNVPEPPTKPGCVFGGWYTSTRYSKQWSFTSGRVTKSFTLYAKWNESDYKVTFDTRVKKLMVAYQTVPWNGYAVEPAAPEREGYFLEGWYTSKTRFTSSYKWNFATRRVTGSVTLYARWLPAKYKVAFNANGGTLADGAAASVLVDYNALVAKPDDPARTGYFFGGWYTSSRYFTSKYEWNFDTRTVKSNVALYARWVRTLSTPKVTAVATVDDTVSVTCSAVQYATGYRFFYTATPLAPETWIQVDSDTPSVSVNGLEADSMYYFKAQAANEEGGVASAVSSAVTETPGKPASPAAAAATYNKITVTWDAVPRCAGYEVYRATSSRGTYYRKGYIGDVSGPSFDDTSLSTGRTYYYKVKAYRMVGTKKVYGAYSTVVSSKCTLQAPATISAESPSATSLKIIWGSVPGATRYEVWRATADKGVYYRLTTTSYTYRTDSGLVTGQPYYYKVRAYRIVSGRKVYGAFAPVVIATPGMAP